MKRLVQNLAFYIEAILLTVIVIGICTLLVTSFGKARRYSQQAELLNDGVILAERAAEAYAAADSQEMLADMLNENENVRLSADGTSVYAFYTFQLKAEAEKLANVQVEIKTQADRRESGVLNRALITVTETEDGSLIYQLETAHFVEEAADDGK